MKLINARTAGITVSTLGLAALSLSFAGAASAGPAQHVQVGVCHATSSDTNPYVWITVDDDSVKLQGHLMHRNEPNKTWKDAGTWNGVDHAAGAAKGDFIEGIDADITEAWCLAGNVDPTVDPTDDPTDEPTTTAPTTDAPTTNAPTTNAPTTDAPTTNAPTTDTPAVVPTEAPTATEKPVVVPTDEPTATEVKPDSQAPGVIPSTGGQPQLAHTGSSTAVLLGLGGALLATGAIFLVAGRKTENV